MRCAYLWSKPSNSSTETISTEAIHEKKKVVSYMKSHTCVSFIRLQRASTQAQSLVMLGASSAIEANLIYI